jgi:hypothetical protein
LKFQDPLGVECPVCGKRSDQAVRQLLARRATCPECGSSLGTVSDRMHQRIDEWNEFAILCRFILELEKILGGPFCQDDDLQGVHCLADLTNLVEKKMEAPCSLDRHVAAIDAIQAAAVTIFPSVEQPPFDRPLSDVFRPHLSEISAFFQARTRVYEDKCANPDTIRTLPPR